MLCCGVKGGLRLHRGRHRSIDIAAGDGALLEQMLAFLGCAVGDIKFAWAWATSSSAFCTSSGIVASVAVSIGGLRLGKVSLAIECGAAKIAILERDKQLAFVNTRSALDEFLARSGALMRGAIAAWASGRKNCICRNLFRDGSDGRMFCLHGDGWFRRLLLLLASDENDDSPGERVTRKKERLSGISCYSCDL